jgi:hypothetical protein
LEHSRGEGGEAIGMTAKQHAKNLFYIAIFLGVVAIIALIVVSAVNK